MFPRIIEALQVSITLLLTHYVPKHPPLLAFPCFPPAVEFGLMSTTTRKETAFEYSGVKSKRGIILEIDTGSVDKGASISFLSQYPGEAEHLFQPLACLEVRPHSIQNDSTAATS
jgi:hypothetical protein